MKEKFSVVKKYRGDEMNISNTNELWSSSSDNDEIYDEMFPLYLTIINSNGSCTSHHAKSAISYLLVFYPSRRIVEIEPHLVEDEKLLSR